jgi:hypothetical protein
VLFGTVQKFEQMILLAGVEEQGARVRMAHALPSGGIHVIEDLHDGLRDAGHHAALPLFTPSRHARGDVGSDQSLERKIFSEISMRLWRAPRRSSACRIQKNPTNRPWSGKKMENRKKEAQGSDRLIHLEGVKKHFKVLNRREGLGGAFLDLFSRDYRYVKAVDGIDLDIARGEIVGFLGPNGRASRRRSR